MDGKMLTRLGAVIFIGVAIAATVIELSYMDAEPQVHVLRPDLSGEATALRQMLRHCRDMGEAATRDPGCLKLWADNRDHFLGQSASSLLTIQQAPVVREPAVTEPLKSTTSSGTSGER